MMRRGLAFCAKVARGTSGGQSATLATQLSFPQAMGIAVGSATVSCGAYAWTARKAKPDAVEVLRNLRKQVKEGAKQTDKKLDQFEQGLNVAPIQNMAIQASANSPPKGE